MSTLTKNSKCLCRKCGSKSNVIEQGILYNRVGCGICREVQNKHTATAIGLMMMAELSIDDLRERIKDIYGELNLEIHIRIAVDGQVVNSEK